MKKAFIPAAIIAIAISCYSFFPANEYIDLSDAVKSGAVKCTITGNKESSHYIKPIFIDIKNRRNVPVNIKINNGMQFEPTDSSYQNMIVTRQELFALKAGGSIKIPLYAMCTENHDRAPNEATIYKPFKQAKGNLLKLTQMVETKKLYDPLGQSAVWAMTCNYPLEDITGYDTTTARQLVRFVAGSLGKKVPPPPPPDDTYRNYYAPVETYKVTMSGKFEYKFNKPKAITIAMFNKDNIVVRELFRNPRVEPGLHVLEYKFDATEYKDEFYYIRLLADGDILLSGKMSMNKDDTNDERN